MTLAKARVGISLPYTGGSRGTADLVYDYWYAGASIAFVAEAYSLDAVSQLGFITARVPNVEIATNILPIYTRTPSLLAMTAAGLDELSRGRFTLGLGASGPQVVEGFHGIRYDAPLARTREVVEICRAVWRRERVDHHGTHYDIPLTRERGGSGLGKPLKLINSPFREQIPVFVASMGPKNVELTAEIAEGWAPFFFPPESARDVWGASLDAGLAKRDPALGPLDTMVPVDLAVGDDVEHLLEAMRPTLALYIGGMGAKGANFYNELATRAGYGAAAAEIQDHYLAGRKEAAEAAVPIELARAISLIGERGYVRERVAAFREAGVTTFIANPVSPEPKHRLKSISALADLLA